MGPGRVLIDQERKGLPDFEHWMPCWEVYRCGNICTNVCIHPYLIACATKIKRFNKTYGSRCWLVLYQQDVRFRHEEMLEILRREHMKLNISIQNGTHMPGVGLDPNRPWNLRWSLLVSSDVKKWWAENCKDYTSMILTGVKKLERFLAGDANITGGSRHHLLSTAADIGGDDNARGSHLTDRPTRPPRTERWMVPF